MRRAIQDLRPAQGDDLVILLWRNEIPAASAVRVSHPASRQSGRQCGMMACIVTDQRSRLR